MLDFHPQCKRDRLFVFEEDKRPLLRQIGSLGEGGKVPTGAKFQF